MIPDPVNGRWPLVTIFGGSGFIGRHFVRTLARHEWRIRVVCRRPTLAGFLQPLGKVGQIQAMQANLRFPDSVAASLRGSDAVVNLVGLLRETGSQRFEPVHAEGSGVLARAAREAGVGRFLQMSAIGADPNSPSAYARTKAAGESAVLETIPDAIVMRPSVVFGPEDQFFNRFAAMARVSPFMPLIGGGRTKFQPVFVGDVAKALTAALEGAGKPGQIYELGGPRIATLREVIEFVCKTTHRSRILTPLPWGAAKAFASVNEIVGALGLLPDWAELTRDQIELLRVDNVVSPQAIADGRTFAAFGIAPDSIEAVAPSYLWRFRKAGQYERGRIA